MSFLRTSFVRFVQVLVTTVLPLNNVVGQNTNTDTRPALAFVGVNVSPLSDSTTVLSDHTVVVRDGRIINIGPRASVTVPTDAIQIAGAGKYLMPGLADMHVHLEHFDDPEYLELFLISGVTSVRSMDGVPQILEWKRRAAAGTLRSPAIYTAGPVLDGDPPVRPENRALRTAADGRVAVEEQAAQGYDFIKVYANLSLDAFRGIVAAARARGLPVAGHIPRAVPLEEFLAANPVSIEHVGDFADAIQVGEPSQQARAAPGRRRLHFQADSSKMFALATRLARSGTWIVPTTVDADRAVARPEVLKAWMADPGVAVIDRGILQYYWQAAVTRAGLQLDEAGWKMVEQSRSNRLALLDAFRRAGVRMLIGTDTPQPFVFPGASVHEELANFVAAGFSPHRALIVATRDAARFMGQQQLWGTVESGKRADLLLLDSNPLQDISATRRIAGVLVQGRWLPASRLQEMRASIERRAAASQ
jgi:imidazolonepropionase-like amidohydrolase